MTDILLDRGDDAVAILTLNRPDAFNAFTYPMYEELLAHLDQLRLDTSVRAVIVTGAGRAFSAGHDLRGGPSASWDDEALGEAYASQRRLAMLARIPQRMRQLPQPVIAAVNGAAAGIGFVLALAADMCIAANSAKFVNALHNVGTGHELGMSWMLPRAVGTQHAAEILLTGRPVPADEAERIGLVLRAVPDEQLMAEARSIAARAAHNAPMAVALTKQSMWLNQGVASLEAACDIEARAVIMARQTRDADEKRQSFLAKRAPRFNHT